jgi:hypothetical protein
MSPPTAVAIVVPFYCDEGIGGAIQAIAKCDLLRRSLAARNGGTPVDSLTRGAFYTMPVAVRRSEDGDVFFICFVCRTMGLSRERLSEARADLGSLGNGILFVFDRPTMRRMLTSGASGPEGAAESAAAADIEGHINAQHCIDQAHVADASQSVVQRARADILDTCARMLEVALPRCWQWMIDALVVAHA